MQRILCCLALACSIAPPAWAQTQVWSEAPKTQRWSEAPQSPVTAPHPPPRTNQWSNSPALPGAASDTAARTGQWSTPTYPQRRSDEDIQRQVDGISRDAERRALAGQGQGNGGRNGSQVPDQAWRDHIDRSRAQEQFQRDQDAYYERQRQYNR